MFSGLEVRVGEADEDFGQLALLEEVWEKLHRVRPDTSHVLIHVVRVL